MCGTHARGFYFSDGLYNEINFKINSQCPAFADFGVSFIDSDFFVAFRTKNGEIVPIEILAEEIGTHSKKATEEIIRASKEKGVNEGNFLYYYANATFKPDDPEKLYNDLKFIGTFKDPRKKYR